MAPARGEVLQGTLDLIVLQTLHAMGPLHGYGIAQRVQQVSEDLLKLNQGTLYPALLRLEQRGWITSKWGASENNRKAKFYSLTRAGRKQLLAETRSWERMTALMARLLAVRKEPDMEWIRIFGARLLGIFRRRQLDGDLDAEL